jgi:ubiquinone/menaquinone biosynthesis C-methylase UbiE
MSEKEIECWWDQASEYYQKEINDRFPKTVHYGPFGSDERHLKLLGDVNGKKVLELGCGGGQCAIALAKEGAICTGLDISKKQLDFARNLAEKNRVKVSFLKGSFSDLTSIKKCYYDIVLSVFSLQYAENLDSVLTQVNRILRRGGLFVFSIDHPFYIMISPDTLKVESSYYKNGKNIELERWPDGSRHKSITYIRKVSDILNSILRSGLTLEAVLEPLDLNDKIWGTGYRRKLIRKIGPTIIFKCSKK